MSTLSWFCVDLPGLSFLAETVALLPYAVIYGSRYPGPHDKIDPRSDAALMMNVYQRPCRTADPRLRGNSRTRRK